VSVCVCVYSYFYRKCDFSVWQAHLVCVFFACFFGQIKLLDATYLSIHIYVCKHITCMHICVR